MVQVRFFGKLKEEFKEQVDSEAGDITILFEELNSTFPGCAILVNGQNLDSLNQKLKKDDTVDILPPVAGG